MQQDPQDLRIARLEGKDYGHRAPPVAQFAWPWHHASRGRASDYNNSAHTGAGPPFVPLIRSLASCFEMRWIEVKQTRDKLSRAGAGGLCTGRRHAATLAANDRAGSRTISRALIPREPALPRQKDIP
ncbi:hypothetical protein PVAP13_9KG549246 [Panicum virgatum]|uniref:Uncharacterized protein n=1 Tax=Panicum virgatum TaxID=38727 RepID=A0A8T0P4I4_PANVG|nr:hypothetical protein PVAP13_9KG549246 [Panicum virgatum]